MRVLIVEDSERIRRSLRTGLSAVGHEIAEAPDGSAGLERVASWMPDAVILDRMMPGIGGLEMLRRMREGGHRMPVLVLSARDTARQRVEGLRAGADDYLVKPFDFEEVCARLEALERRSSGALESQAQGSEAVGNLAGRVLDGKYELGEPIGRGGFSVVYRARHLELDRWVAVKVLRSRLSAVPSGRDLAWLRREGVSACRVRHPGAVVVLDAGQAQGGMPYLVMELLEGETLADELRRRGTLSIPRCATLLGQVCDVLQAAHDAGVVHRDVKPANIFIQRTDDGPAGQRIKVLDFGIAKWLWSESASTLTALETTSLLLGTPLYMAPERLVGREVDGRYDVYSLAAVLYEALSGRPPLEAGSHIIATFTAIAGVVPAPVRDVVPDVPPALAAVIDRGLSKEPQHRPTLAEIRAACDLAAAETAAVGPRPVLQSASLTLSTPSSI